MKNSNLIHYKRVFAPWACKEYFKRLDVTLPWEYVMWKSYGSIKPLPRKTFRPDNLSTYPVLVDLTREVEALLGCKVMGVWCNHYKDGSEHTPYHRDNYGQHVVTVSFGATRVLSTREEEIGIKTTYKPAVTHTIESGDVYYFSPEFDRRHQHAVKPTKKPAGPRISVVFFTTPPLAQHPPPNRWVIDLYEAEISDDPISWASPRDPLRRESVLPEADVWKNDEAVQDDDIKIRTAVGTAVLQETGDKCDSTPNLPGNEEDDQLTWEDITILKRVIYGLMGGF